MVGVANRLNKLLVYTLNIYDLNNRIKYEKKEMGERLRRQKQAILNFTGNFVI